MQAYIKQRKLDDSLASLFGDYVTALDSYTELLASVDKVQRDAVLQGDLNTADTASSAGITGLSVAGAASNSGYSGGDSAAMGAAAGLVTAMVDAYEKDSELQEAKREAITKALHDYQNTYSDCQARAEVTAGSLSTTYSWKKGETGFDEGAENDELRKMITAENWQRVAAILDSKVERRPRDPFIAAVVMSVCAVINESEGKVPEMIGDARGCASAAALVPNGDFYDPYRLRFLQQAADIANRAFDLECKNGGIFDGSSKSAAPNAVKLWDACLLYSTDPSGEIRERRAWAVGATGDLKDALAQAQQVADLRSKTSRFDYNIACLYSRLGDTDTALKWFTECASNPEFVLVHRAKVDPDLAQLRNDKKDDFDQLTHVKWTWAVKWGIIHDDIELTNNSVFTLTNVRFSPTIIVGGKTYQVGILTIGRLGPNESHTFVNAAQIVEGRYDSAPATLVCDQD
jgi:hypothetical protein